MRSIAITALLANAQAINLNKHTKFAVGLPQFDVHGQKLKMKGNTLEEFNVVQTETEAEADYAYGAGKKPYGEKQWQAWAQGLVDHEDHLMTRANTRPPYVSTVQTDADYAYGAGKKPYGEKQWQAWAQGLVDHEDHLMTQANTRPPYVSAVQTDADYAYGAGKKPYGEKQWQGWAQGLVDHEDHLMTRANTRPPYVSTIQTEGAPAHQQDWATPAQRGEDQWAVFRDRNMTVPDRTGASTRDGDWNNRRPYIGAAGLVQTEAEADYAYGAGKKPYGEKQWQAWAQGLVDHEDHLMTKANTRPPYVSALNIETLEENKDFGHFRSSNGELIVKI
jgi:hypothetical protein